MTIRNPQERLQAAQAILDLGAQAVVIKGAIVIRPVKMRKISIWTKVVDLSP